MTNAAKNASNSQWNIMTNAAKNASKNNSSEYLMTNAAIRMLVITTGI